jgi:glutamine synthetase
MDLLKKVARKHKFRILLHEKPFAGINGSGKHNNWSMATNTGVNLLSPGKNPKTNLQFLAFLVNVVKSVHDNQDLLRASVLTEPNSHRLGAHEAPPAIMSVFLGTYLTNVLDDLAEKVTGRKMTPSEKTELKLGIGKIPEILLDNTDRNRTSPFAFTGNRFEFRAVGSSASCAPAMIALNAAVASTLRTFKIEVDNLIEKGVKKDEAILQIMKRYIVESATIRFEGDGYSEVWHREAEERGLTNIKSVPESISKYLTEKSREVLVEGRIFTDRELESRVEVEYEKFIKKVQIEARVLGDLAINHIVPTAIQYMTVLLDNIKALRAVFNEIEYERLAGARRELIVSMSDQISLVKKQVAEMIEERKKANIIINVHERALAYEQNVRPYLDNIRYQIDKLELIVDNEIWPLPKYRELLFTR